MLPIVISASAFQQSEQLCLQTVVKMTEHLPDAISGILLDKTYIQHAVSSSNEVIPVSRFTLAEWLDENKVPLAVTIREHASELSANQAILLDARYHEPHVISAVLQIVSRTWFHLTNWQPAFVLIVDDFYCTHFVRELADVFYILPLSSSKQTIQAEVKAICLRAQYLRWIGLGRFARLTKAMLALSNKLKRYVKQQITT